MAMGDIPSLQHVRRLLSERLKKSLTLKDVSLRNILTQKSKDDTPMALPAFPVDMWKMLNERDDFAIISQQAQLAQNAQSHYSLAQATHSGAQANTTPSLGNRAKELFLKRMGGIRAELRIAEGDFLQCHVYGEMVHVFYCFAGKPGVTQEHIDMFPSDTLITQFRMILAC